MKTLREDLRTLAEQAPTVDLAARAVRGARRRRATRLVVATVAALCVISGGGAALLQQASPAPRVVLAPPETTVLPLPKKGAGTVEQMYRPRCRDMGEPCADDVWRIMTREGDTYELTAAAAGPLAVTPDGRRIAYYSSKQRRLVVRDLASGEVWKAPLTQSMEDQSVEYTLRLSPSGLRFVVSARGGRRELNKLVDVERGTVTDLPRGWWPVSVSDGSGPVVLAKPYDMTSQVWVLGHAPITVQDFTYHYSSLAPDGRTLVRLGRIADRGRAPMARENDSLVVFDAIRGGGETRVPISGLPEGFGPSWLGSWLNDTELTVLATSREPNGPASAVYAVYAVYAVDVRTGRSRELFALRDDGPFVVPGLIR